MNFVGAILFCAVFLIIFGGISADVGWDILEDYDWFREHIKISKSRRIVAYIFLATLGIPFVWTFLIIGIIMTIVVSGYEIIRYGHTTS